MQSQHLLPNSYKKSVETVRETTQTVVKNCKNDAGSCERMEKTTTGIMDLVHFVAILRRNEWKRGLVGFARRQ